MPERILPTNRPSRAVRTRRATIHSVDPDNTSRYFVTFEGGQLPEPAFSSGMAFALGQSVQVEAQPEKHRWKIVTDTNNGVVVDELMIPGYDWKNNTIGNPPMVGFNVTSGGIGKRFGPAEEGNTMTQPARGVSRVAWHPSGRAVAYMDVDIGQIECWEWIPGVGFGRKYDSIYPWEVDYYWQSVYSPVLFSANGSWGDVFGGEIAFSPDGNYLAVAGDVGEFDNTYNFSAMCLRFTLGQGFDLSNLPVFDYTTDVSTYGQANCCAWSPNGRFLAVGTDGALLVYPFEPSGGGSFDAPTIELTEDVTEVAWHPSGEYVAIGTQATPITGSISTLAVVAIYAWDGAVLTLSCIDFDPEREEIHALQFHPDGLYLMFMYLFDDGAAEGLYVIEFNPAGGGSVGTLTKLGDFTDAFSTSGASFNPSGSLLVVGGLYSGSYPDFIDYLRLFSFASGVVTEIETKLSNNTEWGPHSGYLNDTLAWRPKLTA